MKKKPSRHTAKTGKRVEDTGIWFHSSGILGASPDGIVDDQTVTEAKCPYTERNMRKQSNLQQHFVLRNVKVNCAMP